MRAEFNGIYWAMLNSETIADGEYYVIHADHIHDFKMAIDNYLEEKHKIEKIKNYTANVGKVDDSNIDQYIHILFGQQTTIIHKLDEIIDRINKMEEE